MYEMCDDGVDQDCDGLDNGGEVIDGQVYDLDSDSDGFANYPEEYLDISTSGFHTCAVNADTSISRWGTGTAASVPAAGQVSDAPTDTGYSAVSVGLAHSCAIRDAGDHQAVICWGANPAASEVSFGQADVPGVLLAEPGYAPPDVTHARAGMLHTCVLLDETQASSAGVSQIHCFGADDESNDDYGQVRDAPTDAGYVAISSGAFSACAIDDDGHLHCWGLVVPSQVTPQEKSTAISRRAGPLTRYPVQYGTDQMLGSRGSLPYRGWDGARR